MTFMARMEWPARQMFSPSKPIGRAQIFNAFASAAAALADTLHAPPEKVGAEEIPGCDMLGYDAERQRWRIDVGAAHLTLEVDPILASMGVSGERITVQAEGFGAGVELRGEALSSARAPSWASLAIEGVARERGEVALAAFAEAFPRVMSAEQIDAELNLASGGDDA